MCVDKLHEMASFFVYLSSNVDHPFGANTNSNFTTKLANPLRLYGNWEVGLTEISYTNSYSNVPGSLIYFRNVFDRMEDISWKPLLHADFPGGHYHSPAGVCEVLNELIEAAVAEHHPNWKQAPYLYYNKTTNRVDIYSGIEKFNNAYRPIFIRFDKGLEEYFGFRAMPVYELVQERKLEYTPNNTARIINIMTKHTNTPRHLFTFDRDPPRSMNKNNIMPLLMNQIATSLADTVRENIRNSEGQSKGQGTPEEIKLEGQSVSADSSTVTQPDDQTAIRTVTAWYVAKSDEACDFKGGIYSFNVYASNVDPVNIGDVNAPLLAIVPTPPSGFSFGDQFVVKFEHPQYKKVMNSEIDTIEINIRKDSDTGELVPFSFGRTIIVLHFRNVESVS